jgi:hypothetical protein
MLMATYIHEVLDEVLTARAAVLWIEVEGCNERLDHDIVAGLRTVAQEVVCPLSTL